MQQIGSMIASPVRWTGNRFAKVPGPRTRRAERENSD